jgi:hypothetical protein
MLYDHGTNLSDKDEKYIFQNDAIWKDDNYQMIKVKFISALDRKEISMLGQIHFYDLIKFDIVNFNNQWEDSIIVNLLLNSEP